MCSISHFDLSVWRSVVQKLHQFCRGEYLHSFSVFSILAKIGLGKIDLAPSVLTTSPCKIDRIEDGYMEHSWFSSWRLVVKTEWTAARRVCCFTQLFSAIWQKPNIADRMSSNSAGNCCILLAYVWSMFQRFKIWWTFCRPMTTVTAAIFFSPTLSNSPNWGKMGIQNHM